MKHPVREVALDYQTYPMRRVRSRQLLPTERDRVLLLVADQLMEYNAANRQTRTLKRSAGTRLGLFQDLGEARDGGMGFRRARFGADFRAAADLGAGARMARVAVARVGTGLQPSESDRG